jgi:hypothetical protein
MTLLVFKTGWRTILTEIGIVDNGLYPFGLPAEGMPQHLKFKNSQRDEEGSCFPFHTVCWELYSDYYESASVKGNLNNSFTVLNSGITMARLVGATTMVGPVLFNASDGLVRI